MNVKTEVKKKALILVSGGTQEDLDKLDEILNNNDIAVMAFPSIELYNITDEGFVKVR